MGASYQSKIEFWKAHVAGAEAHAEGVGAYCREHGLMLSTYYGWRRVVKNGEPHARRPKSPQLIRQKTSAFIPVEVLPEPVEISSPVRPSAGKLPDPQWVADVMLNLIRGLS